MPYTLHTALSSPVICPTPTHTRTTVTVLFSGYGYCVWQALYVCFRGTSAILAVFTCVCCIFHWYEGLLLNLEHPFGNHFSLQNRTIYFSRVGWKRDTLHCQSKGPCGTTFGTSTNRRGCSECEMEGKNLSSLSSGCGYVAVIVLLEYHITALKLWMTNDWSWTIGLIGTIKTLLAMFQLSGHDAWWRLPKCDWNVANKVICLSLPCLVIMMHGRSHTWCNYYSMQWVSM